MIFNNKLLQKIALVFRIVLRQAMKGVTYSVNGTSS